MSLQAQLKVQRHNFALEFNADINMQAITAVLGPSGCGKTTLLRAIAGLEQLPSATLKINDQLWQDANTFVPTYKRSLAYVFQEASLFSHLNVRQNILYGVKRVAAEKREACTQMMQRTIEILGIAALLERKTQDLSGGERQRVAIARAVAVNPRLLLMDEPLASLDAQRKQELLPYIRSLHQELQIPIIYVTHALDEVARIADQLIVLDSGKVLAHGDVHDLYTRLDLPLAQGPDAESLIEATVAGHDEAYGLSTVQSSAGLITVAGADLAIGQAVRVRIAARDVSITSDQQSDTSILNIFSATVQALEPASASQVTVKLQLGAQFLLARITKKSADRLELKPGKQVFAQVKSAALLPL